MKKAIYALILSLLVVSGLVYANREISNEPAKKSIPTLSVNYNAVKLIEQLRGPAAEIISERAKWEASPDGIRFKKWEVSPAGKKVYAAESNIRKHLNDSSNMEAVVTSLSLPPGSRLGFGVMARINGDDYIVVFPAEKSSELQQSCSLQVNNKLIIRSRNVSHAPKYAYPIISAEYVERDSKIIYKRAPRKGGC